MPTSLNPPIPSGDGGIYEDLCVYVWGFPTHTHIWYTLEIDGFS